MTINEGIETYRIPMMSTPEDLELRWRTVITYGEKVLLAGHYYTGKNKPCFFGATYYFLTDDHSCEGRMALQEVSEVEFYDEGHALAWAMQQ